MWPNFAYFPPVPKASYLRLAFAVEYAMNVQEYSVNAWYCSPFMLLIAFILRQKKVRCSQVPTHSVVRLSLFRHLTRSENISLEPGGVVRLQRQTWTSTANSVGPSNATATALTRATQPRLLQIDSWLWQFTLMLDEVHLCTSLFLCRPQNFHCVEVFPSNEERKLNLLCWF